MKLPEGLSASGAGGETRGAMVGDQSLRKAGWVVVDRFSHHRRMSRLRAARQDQSRHTVAAVLPGGQHREDRQASTV